MSEALPPLPNYGKKEMIGQTVSKATRHLGRLGLLKGGDTWRPGQQGVGPNHERLFRSMDNPQAIVGEAEYAKQIQDRADAVQRQRYNDQLANKRGPAPTQHIPHPNAAPLVTAAPGTIGPDPSRVPAVRAWQTGPARAASEILTTSTDGRIVDRAIDEADRYIPEDAFTISNGVVGHEDLAKATAATAPEEMPPTQELLNPTDESRMPQHGVEHFGERYAAGVPGSEQFPHR